MSLVFKMFGRLLLISVGLISVAVTVIQTKSTDELRHLYEKFKRDYNKEFTDDEDSYRFEIFRSNYRLAKFYQLTERGTAVYGITQFSDLTAEEFSTRYANLKLDVDKAEPAEDLTYNVDQMPEKIDWRELGAVTPVESQGSCGSCWSFSVMGNIEGQWYRKTGNLLTLSKQQLVDCDEEDAGCQGGLPMNAYSQLIAMGGIESQKAYPYTQVQGVCRLDESQFVAFINTSLMLSSDETEQAAWLAQNGPMSVALNAFRLQFYIRGILNPWRIFCWTSYINHAVLTVGYGIEGGQPYWIVKNSWGSRFGEQGYFRIHRGGGSCGINSYVTSAIIS